MSMRARVMLLTRFGDIFPSGLTRDGIKTEVLSALIYKRRISYTYEGKTTDELLKSAKGLNDVVYVLLRHYFADTERRIGRIRDSGKKLRNKRVRTASGTKLISTHYGQYSLSKMINAIELEYYCCVD